MVSAHDKGPNLCHVSDRSEVKQVLRVGLEIPAHINRSQSDWPRLVPRAPIERFGDLDTGQDQPRHRPARTQSDLSCASFFFGGDECNRRFLDRVI